MNQRLENVQEQEYYGQIAHWFNGQKIGSIKPDSQSISDNILLISQNLPDFYISPQVGDEVCYRVGKDKYNRLYATSIEPLPSPKEGGTIRMTVKSWDRQQNGGYGIYGLRKQVPVFILGQHLHDQTRIPEVGEVLKGRLVLHDNNHWLLTEAEIVDKVDIRDIESDGNEREHRLEAERKYARSSYAGRVYASQKQNRPFPASQNIASGRTMQFNGSAEKIGKNAGVVFPAFTVLKGRIVKWDDKKGFGFIESGLEGRQVFFHIKAFHYTGLRPKEGQQVSFYCNKPVSDARQQAVRVVSNGHEQWLYVDEPYRMESVKTRYGDLLLTVPVCTAYLFWIYVHSWKMAVAYSIVSLMAIVLYQADKRTAEENVRAPNYGKQRRIPEKTLHLLALVGGWPGALMARPMFNHKTAKSSFIFAFWLVAAANAAITYAVLVRFADEPLLAFLRN